MKTLPDSLMIALWVTGIGWALAIFAYLLDAPTEWMLPLLALGAVTGVAEWILRRKTD